MDKIYRFYAYNNTWWPDKYLWYHKQMEDYLMMSAANFIDTLLAALGPDPFNPREETRPVIETEIIHVDMDKLKYTNPILAQKTIRMVQDFDDVSLSPTTINDWLNELEDWVCGKIINSKEQ